MNFPLVSAILAIFFAQAVKYPIALFTRKKPQLKIITSTGGMPSSHSAAVSSLITALIIDYGFSSPYVAIATVFGVIIMFDSMGVRRQSGDQGYVIDKMYHKLQTNHPDIIEEVPGQIQNPLLDEQWIENYSDLIVTKYLGHKPTEVFAGIYTGGMVAIVVHFIRLNFK